MKRIQLNLCQHWLPILSKKDSSIELLFRTCQTQTKKYNQQQLHLNVSNTCVIFFDENPKYFNNLNIKEHVYIN